MSNSNQGAELQAQSAQPSIDLATLVNLLARALPVTSSVENDAKHRPLFLYDPQKKRLRICTSGALLRLFFLKQFKEAFNSEKGKGFLQDFTAPSYGFRSRVGGTLTQGNDQKLPKAVDQLTEAIAQQLEQAIPPGVSWENFLLEDVAGEFQKLAQKVGASFRTSVASAKLFPLTFDDSTSSKRDSKGKVAKIISAIERIDTGNYFERMCKAIADELETEYGSDEDEVDEAIATLEAEYNRVESQINRFISFLNDEALSRVRLNLTFRIMEAIAQKAENSSNSDYQLLAEYVKRVNYFVELVKEEGLILDVTATYGLTTEVNFSEYIHNAKFFSSLAVWPEWKTQIFEAKQTKTDSTDTGIVREISYRFRINGNNPNTRKSAFESRLEDIQEDLEKNKDDLSPGLIKWRLAELVFLSVVVPQDPQKLTKKEFDENVNRQVEEIHKDPVAVISAILENLLQKNSLRVMDSISTGLISIIRTKGEKIISQVHRETAQQYICIKKDIVDWDRLQGAEPGTKDLLQSAASKKIEKVAWLKQIEVSSSPTVPNLLFSLKVSTELSERDLVIKGDEQSIQLQRQLSGKILQIIFVPHQSLKDENGQVNYKVSPLAPSARAWAFPTAIQVEYETRTLQLSKNDENVKQLHAAAVTAFIVLVYVCLWCILQKIRQSQATENTLFSTSILRLQDNREDDEKSGERYVYAAAQAIESMLAQEQPTRMQGMVLSNRNLKGSQEIWIKRSVFNALLSVFPIAISTDKKPEVPKVGLISYIARPCDETSQTEAKNHLILSQSYIATAIETPFSGYELKTERTRSDIIYSVDHLHRQRLIQEEVAHLQQQGCEHIILLSHAYGSRRVNRTVDYNTPLMNREFLQQLYQTFPNLTLYTMLRDVFTGTRFRKRDKGEAGFEILRVRDHTHFLNSFTEMGLRDIFPVYTFATLHVVESNEQERPQSGFCVYFLLSDSQIDYIDQTERSRQHLIDPEQNSEVHPCLLAVLRGLHFLEAERNQYTPVLDPFGWISPNTVEAAGEVPIMHSRRKGKVLLSYPAILTHIAGALRRKNHVTL
ncbi:MAG: hypothetical protein ACOC04_04295 [Halothece sp.]